MIFKWSWESGEFDCNLANIFPREGITKVILETTGLSVLLQWPVSVEKSILGIIEKHPKDNAGIGQSQYGFMRGKSYSVPSEGREGL